MYKFREQKLSSNVKLFSVHITNLHELRSSFLATFKLFFQLIKQNMTIGRFNVTV